MSEAKKDFLCGPGKQELYEGSGVFISTVEIQNIHIEAGKRPTEVLNKLVGFFFTSKPWHPKEEASTQ